MGSEIIVDTSALIEYVFATEKGRLAKEIIENQENIIIVPSIVIGEFVSKLERTGVRNIQEIVDNLGEYSVSIPLTVEICFKAGKKHSELRKLDNDISLIDCIVMEIAEEHSNALILAKDPHFKHYKNTKLL